MAIQEFEDRVERAEVVSSAISSHCNQHFRWLNDDLATFLACGLAGAVSSLAEEGGVSFGDRDHDSKEGNATAPPITVGLEPSWSNHGIRSARRGAER